MYHYFLYLELIIPIGLILFPLEAGASTISY